MKCNFIDLGRVEFKEAERIQEELIKARLEDKIPDTILLVEHDPVYTMGRERKNGMESFLKVPKENLKAPVYEIDRGGNITYHGPGQIVCYPIINFSKLIEKNPSYRINDFMDDLEKVIEKTLNDYGIEVKLKNGVWYSDTKKVGAVGVGLKSFEKMKITKHGFAFDVNTDKSYFDSINPCGYTGVEAITASEVLGRDLDMGEVKDKVKGYFKQVFNYEESETESLTSIETLINS